MDKINDFSDKRNTVKHCTTEFCSFILKASKNRLQ